MICGNSWGSKEQSQTGSKNSRILETSKQVYFEVI
jgi:hypothetical protein